MDTYSIVLCILQALVPILGIVLACYQLRKEKRNDDHTNEKSEPSASPRPAHLHELDIGLSFHVRFK